MQTPVVSPQADIICKYVRKYGLLILEQHTIDPKKISRNLGATATTAYDSTHGYSDQYIVEVKIMLEAALEAGLESINKHRINFPSNNLANVSINLLKSKISKLLSPFISETKYSHSAGYDTPSI